MNQLPCECSLLAQRSRLEEVTSVLRNRPSQIDTQYVLTGLLVLTAIVLAMWLLSQILARQERRKSYNSAWMMFFSLCKAHGLSWSDRWFLWRVARHQRLRDPARLFLEPERLADDNLSPALRLRQAQWKGLRGRLFADLEGTAGGPSGARRSPGDAPQEPPAAGAASLGFPIADKPVLDVPPWASQRGAGGR